MRRLPLEHVAGRLEDAGQKPRRRERRRRRYRDHVYRYGARGASDYTWRTLLPKMNVALFSSFSISQFIPVKNRASKCTQYNTQLSNSRNILYQHKKTRCTSIERINSFLTQFLYISSPSRYLLSRSRRFSAYVNPALLSNREVRAFAIARAENYAISRNRAFVISVSRRRESPPRGFLFLSQVRHVRHLCIKIERLTFGRTARASSFELDADKFVINYGP